MNEVSVRMASAAEIMRVRATYEAWGYGGGVKADDLVFLAEHAGALVGIVRQTIEHNVVMLRGMQVAPAAWGSRVGTQLLRVFICWLSGEECYCIPYTHLVEFYNRAGFDLCCENAAPAFLRQRLLRYHQEGRDVLLMRRPAAPRYCI